MGILYNCCYCKNWFDLFDNPRAIVQVGKTKIILCPKCKRDYKKVPKTKRR